MQWGALPVLLTALLVALTHGWLNPAPILRDAPLHRSPNAGWPESAVACVLNIALAGPRSYDGELRDFPWVYGEGNRRPGAEAIDRAIAVLWQVWRLMLGLVVLLSLV